MLVNWQESYTIPMYEKPFNLREGIEIIEDRPIEIKGEDRLRNFF